MHIIKKIPWNCDAYGSREDLTWAKYAQELGYTIRSKDGFNPRCQSVPMDSLSFIKDQTWVWTADGLAWIAADLVDGKFQYHRKYEYLRDALTEEAK